MEQDSLYTDALAALLRDHCSPAVVRAIENGASPDTLWSQLETSGFADALVPEPQGGAGLSLAQAWPLWALCGAHALPVPLAETMLARALLAQAGFERPAGSLTLAQVHALLPQPDLRLLEACVHAALLAGALGAVFERSLAYANERIQFGRPIGKFQAIQHQLSQMAEEVFAARMAAQIGCQAEPAAPLSPVRARVAVAKARTSAAALTVANLAHAIHGAIGFTAEYDLNLYTRRLHQWRQTAGSEGYWQSVLGEALLDGPHALSLDLLRATTDIA